MSFSESDGYYESDDDDHEPCLILKEEIRRGDFAAVSLGLQGGADPNYYDPEYADEIFPFFRGRYTLIHWAAGRTDESIRHGHSHVRIVRLLLDHGAKVNRIWTLFSPFHGLTLRRPMDMTDDGDVLAMLYRASVEQALAASESDLHDNQNLFVRNDFRMEMDLGLISAAHLGRTDDCISLCRAGAELNSCLFGTTPLAEACENGYIKTVRCLVELGSEINFDTDSYGSTALRSAAASGHLSIVELLLEHGADPLMEHEVFGLIAQSATSEAISIVLCAESVNRLVQRFPTLQTSWTSQISLANGVALACIQNGHHEGVTQLCGHRNFQIPSLSLQTAVYYGQFDILSYLLRSGALATWEEADFSRGFSCSSESYPRRQIRETNVTRIMILYSWTKKVFGMGTSEPPSLFKACCMAVYKAGINNFDLTALPDDIKCFLEDDCCPDPPLSAFEADSQETKEARLDLLNKSHPLSYERRCRLLWRGESSLEV